MQFVGGQFRPAEYRAPPDRKKRGPQDDGTIDSRYCGAFPSGAAWGS